MDISALPIRKTLVDLYERKGLTTLYPPQAACVDQGLFSGKNLLVAVPTASGKTLVAEMAMHHHIASGGKCLYIVPLKALASEKFEEFSNKGVRVGISTGDFDRRDDALGRNDIIVATSEKVDSLMRNLTTWLTEITLLVVDEIHLIDSPDRGATLEMVITKFRYRNPRLQLLGLSATIGNPASLAGWLDAELVTSRWRPVPLREGVYYRGVIYFTDGERPVEQPSKHDDLNLCLDTVAEGGQCLVFVSSRKNAEAFAKRAATALRCSDPALDAYGKKIRSLAETERERILADCVGSGAAFHHAGLSREERGIVEEGFRKGSIRCIASTPTLAAGLNLPARRVIIRDYLRFQAHEGMLPIPVREYHQMAGRAGRPHLDPYGEAVLIAKNRDSLRGLCEYYIEAPPEDVTSRCAGSWALGSHILSLIATRFAASRADVSAFLDRTFYRYQKQDPRELQESIDQILGFIISAEMVTENGGRLSATEYGSLVSQLYLDPRGAETIVASLRLAEQFSTVGMLQRICSTPDMPRLYVRKNDMGYLDRFVCEHDGELWVDFPRYGDDEIELFYESLKTAMLLADWIDEVTDETICERYGVGQGDIYSIVESVKWLAHASTRLSRMFAPRHMPQLIDLERRIRDGVRPELLPLVSLRGIGRVRARRLFNNGITGPEAILAAGREAITPILGRGVTEQVFRQLEKDPEPEDTDDQTRLDIFGGPP